jgi:hypothetical protein
MLADGGERDAGDDDQAGNIGRRGGRHGEVPGRVGVQAAGQLGEGADEPGRRAGGLLALVTVARGFHSTAGELGRSRSGASCPGPPDYACGGRRFNQCCDCPDHRPFENQSP